MTDKKAFFTPVFALNEHPGSVWVEAFPLIFNVVLVRFAGVAPVASSLTNQLASVRL
jgi:hypothetical protein